MFFERVCSTIDSVASTTQGNTLWALTVTDHLGSVRDLVDNNGRIRVNIRSLLHPTERFYSQNELNCYGPNCDRIFGRIVTVEI